MNLTFLFNYGHLYNTNTIGNVIIFISSFKMKSISHKTKPRQVMFVISTTGSGLCTVESTSNLVQAINVPLHGLVVDLLEQKVSGYHFFEVCFRMQIAVVKKLEAWQE